MKMTASQQPQRVVMVYDINTSFIRRDMAIFESKGYDVVRCEIQPESAGKFAWSVLRQVWMLLRYGGRNTLWVCQSAGYLSFFPALFSKVLPMRCMVIVIGTDGACLPEIDYGHYRKPMLKYCAGVSLKNCQGIATVHHSLERSDYTYFDVEHKHQGFHSFIPGIRTEVREIVYGFDDQKWGCDVPFSDRKPDLLTVFVASWAKAAIRKGFDLIVEAAEAMPHRQFLVVGEIPEGFDVPDNLKVQGNVDQTQLRTLFNDHQFYLQVSAFEGFPNALCEAMACGCIPIGSRVAGIPDIIDEWGEIIDRKEVKQLVQAIERADERGRANPNVAQEISDGLFARFPLSRRRDELVGFAEEIMAGRAQS